MRRDLPASARHGHRICEAQRHIKSLAMIRPLPRLPPRQHGQRPKRARPVSHANPRSRAGWLLPPPHHPDEFIGYRQRPGRPVGAQATCPLNELPLGFPVRAGAHRISQCGVGYRGGRIRDFRWHTVAGDTGNPIAGEVGQVTKVCSLITRQRDNACFSGEGRAVVLGRHFASRARRRFSIAACQASDSASAAEPSDRRTATKHRDRIMVVIGRSISLGPISSA
jgi:hypothetical protein